MTTTPTEAEPAPVRQLTHFVGRTYDREGNLVNSAPASQRAEAEPAPARPLAHFVGRPADHPLGLMP
jgi:hypothetical protein